MATVLANRFSALAVDDGAITATGYARPLRGDGTTTKGLAIVDSGKFIDTSLTSYDGPSGTPEPQAADTVPGNSSTTATITPGNSVDVSIDTIGDHDWYAITLTAGVAYTFHTSSDSTGADSYLTLRNSAGTEVASDDDSGDGTYSLIGYTPSVTGTYYIDAGTYGDESTGTFHLSVATALPAGADSVGGTIGTAGALAVSGSIDGRIDTNGDHDFYAITLTAGQTYIFRTGGINSSTTTDTILTLRDASGVQIQTNDDSGEASFSAIRYTATTTGTYYLDVSAYNTGTGNFNLTAFTTPTPTLYTNDQIANQLTNGYWGGSSHHFGVTAGGSLTFNVQALTAAGQTLARAALLVWTDVTGITFNEVTTGGQIVYDDNQDGAFANASISNGIITSATVNVSTQWLTNYGTGTNTYSFQTYLHETGHALGLGHGGNYNGNASYAADSLYLNDSWATTVMSYFDQQENSYFAGLGFTREFVLTPMMADGIAMTVLYGTATTTRTGNTTYGFNNTSGQALYDATQFPTVGYTIYDNGGTDTLDYSGFSQNQVINLNAETFSNIGSRVGNVSIARGTVIENAIGGSGNDTITGNDVANSLTGNGGTDTLIGGGGDDILDGSTGADSMSGGTGSDTYFVDNAGDTVFEVANGNLDTDTINTYITYTLAAGQEVERLRAMPGTDPVNLTGNEFGQKVVGNEGANILTGGGGNDNLVGNGGADRLIGGTGLDKLTGGDGIDTFVMQIGGQFDRIVDFVTGTDKVDVSAFGMTFAQILAATTESGGTSTIDLGGGDSVQLVGVAKASLSASDFILGGSGAVIPWDDMFGGEAVDDAAISGIRGFDMLAAQLNTDALHTAFDWHLM